jgi:tetratricopeptide (TPR) repeat protein
MTFNNSLTYLGAALNRLTQIYIKMEQYEKAMSSIEESIDIAKKTGDIDFLQDSLRVMAGEEHVLVCNLIRTPLGVHH